MKSAGLDGIGQGLLLIVADIIATPQTRIIRKLIENGVFPEEWKKSNSNTNLKKGTKKTKELPCSSIQGS